MHVKADILFNHALIDIRKVSYQVIATAHHTGEISSGHWTTKIKLQDQTWWLLDSLKTSALKGNPPGLRPGESLILFY